MTDWYWSYLKGKFKDDWNDVLPDPDTAAGASVVPAADPIQPLVERLREWLWDDDIKEIVIETIAALEAKDAEIERLKEEVAIATLVARAAKDEIERLREALEKMVYEATHLSPQEENGDHKCTISAAALRAARAALKGGDWE